MVLHLHRGGKVKALEWLVKAAGWIKIIEKCLPPPEEILGEKTNSHRTWTYSEKVTDI